MAKEKTKPGVVIPGLIPDPGVCEAIERFMMEKFGCTRPPVLTGKVLGMIMKLEQEGEYFPKRDDIAKTLKCSPFGVDSVVSVALVRELIREHYDVMDSPTPGRSGVYAVRKKRFATTALLRNAVDRLNTNKRRRALV